MISSEVQRTLVKSPPELWNELSDPDALARHLGELGEIKITRVEPENLVEWEAEDTTGTVEIKPSGWGTRVTLTVSREHSADEVDGGPEDVAEAKPLVSEAPEAADPQPEAEQAAPEPGAADPELEAEPAAAAEPGAADPQPEAEPAAAAAPATTDENERREDAPARKPAPATEAARRAAGWPSAGATAGPAIESDLRASEALDGPPAAPGGVQEWAAQALEEPGDLGGAEGPQVQEQQDPEPRRGFFARLFGRRRRSGGPGAAPEPPRLTRFEPSQATAETESADELGARAETDDVSLQDVEESPEHVDGDAALDVDGVLEGADESGAAAGIDIDGEIDAEAEIDTERDFDADSEAYTEADTDAEWQHGTPEPDTVAPAAETDPAASGPEPELRAGAEDPEPEDPPSAAPQPAADVAAERVEAVLEAVLDRLGAAHHRPFSRP